MCGDGLLIARILMQAKEQRPRASRWRPGDLSGGVGLEASGFGHETFSC